MEVKLDKDAEGDSKSQFNVDYFWSDDETAFNAMLQEGPWRVLTALRNTKKGSIEDDFEEKLKNLKWNEEPLSMFANDKEALISLITNCVTTQQLSLSAKSSSEKISLTLTKPKMYAIIFPINKEEYENGLTCYFPVANIVEATGSPKLNTGFQLVNYPKDDYNPGVRIGLEELQKACMEKGKMDFSDHHAIRIPVRNPRNGYDKPSDLKLLEGEGGKIYLESTDDPTQKQQSEIGIVRSLVAKNNQYENKNYMDIVFFNDFTPHEGCTYYLNFQFQLDEKEETTLQDEESTTGECNYGSLTFPMHIVPRYQKWIGSATDNWNDDTKWIRSTVEELRKTEKDSYENYTDDGLNHNGFVPMSFTYVTVPAGMSSQVELYNAETKNDKNETTSIPNKPEILDLVNSSSLGAATSLIEYDLMADAQEPVGDSPNAGAQTLTYCRSYYTNTVKEIHFEPSTEMKNMQLLTYEKAWVDYDLAPNRWYTLASPLQAVVAGDWYVPSDGYRQNTEHFQPITFQLNKHNRFNPAVYQRGWDKGIVNRYEAGNSNTQNTISGNWSIVYNDVAVPYNPGQGFSIKTVPNDNNSNNVLFRLPKNDSEYSYYQLDNKDGINKVDLQRTGNTGKLSGITKVSITNQAEDNQYFLVGNPFMAHLDMTRFFERNAGELGNNKKFWIIDKDNQLVSVENKNDEGWLTTGSSGVVT
ncbi:MAG: hypothetical protein LUD46_21405 [Parabacteroides sp.]|nr:hypothetical protein [Parabacteroides sp.]